MKKRIPDPLLKDFLKEIDQWFLHVLNTLNWKLKGNCQYKMGSSSVAIRFETSDGRFIFRVPKHSHLQIRRILLAYQHFESFDCLPKLFYKDEKCLIEEYIQGKNLLENPNPDLAPLGELLSRIHTIKSIGYGHLTHGTSGIDPDIDTTFCEDIQNGLKRLHQSGLLSKTKFLQIESLLEKRPKPAIDQTFVGHGDLSPGNIIFHKNRVTLIDLDAVGSFHREYEMNFLYANPGNFHSVKKLLNFYQHELNPQLIHYFALANMIRLIGISKEHEDQISKLEKRILFVLENPFQNHI